MPKKQLLIYTLIYFIIHFPLLLNTGIYWDDWSLIGNSLQGVKEQFINNGVIIGYYWHLPFLKYLGGEIAYHIFTFIAYYFIYLFAYRSAISSVFNLNKNAAFLFLLILAVQPFNESKITAICSYYTITLLCFTIGFYYLHCAAIGNKKWWAIPFVFIGFLTPSVSFFYVVLLVLLAAVKYFHINIKTWVKQFTVQGIKYFGVYGLVAILSFVAYKKIFIPNQAQQAGYNEVKNTQLVKLPLEIAKVTYINGIEFWQQAKGIVHNILPFLGLAVLIVIATYKTTKNHTPSKLNVWVLVAAIVLWSAAMIPYIAVGKLPTFYEHLTRHHLLTVFGFALIVAWFLVFFKNKYIYTGSIVFVLTFLGSITHKQYVQYEIEKIKSQRLQFAFNTDAISLNQSFIVKDNTPDLNSNENPNRFYTYSGIARSVFKTQTRFFADSLTYTYMVGEPNKYATAEFNTANYKKEDFPDAQIRISQKQGQISQLQKWQWALSSWFYSENSVVKQIPIVFKIDVFK